MGLLSYLTDSQSKIYVLTYLWSHYSVNQFCFANINLNDNKYLLKKKNPNFIRNLYGVSWLATFFFILTKKANQIYNPSISPARGRHVRNWIAPSAYDKNVFTLTLPRVRQRQPTI